MPRAIGRSIGKERGIGLCGAGIIGGSGSGSIARSSARKVGGPPKKEHGAGGLAKTTRPAWVLSNK